MARRFARLVAALWGAASVLTAWGQHADPRLKEVWFDASAVVTVLVKRGVVTQIALDEGDAITEVGTGLGSDCSKADASWCVAAQAGGRNIFVKPKSTAGAPNNLAVVTDKRSYAFELVVLPEGDARAPVYRLAVRTTVRRIAMPAANRIDFSPTPAAVTPQAASADDLIAERLQAAPKVVNAEYSIAESPGSTDIIPTLVFDDGRFTYLGFPNNRELPAVFHVLPDGSETLVNTRMEGELLVVDRVSRRMVLRAGSAVVGLWNEAFDLDGVPPKAGTTVDGVARFPKAARAQMPNRRSQGGNP